MSTAPDHTAPREDTPLTNDTSSPLGNQQVPSLRLSGTTRSELQPSREESMRRQRPYLKLAGTYYDTTEEGRGPLLKMLEYAANHYTDFRELRAAVRAIKAGI